MNKRTILSILFALIGFANAAALTANTDSLIAVARQWRDMGDYVRSLDALAHLNTDEARYETAYTHYLMGKTSQALAEGKALINSSCRHDALILTALCREKQGFDKAAIRIYKSLIKEESAVAALRYASVLYRKGKDEQTVQMLQKAISIDRSMPEAHFMLAGIMANKGERFKAMMPLYYYLLISDDKETSQTAHKQLVSLWKKSARVIDILKRGSAADPFNDAIDRQIATWATSDSIAHLSGNALVTALLHRTDSLLSYLADTSADNLDFWQITYTDFFLKLKPRGYVEPFVYYISGAACRTDVMQWIEAHNALFNEFCLWMEAQ